MASELEDASQVASDLVSYVDSILPMWLTAPDGARDPAIQTQWIPVRITETLESVLLLGEGHRHNDAAALVRVMVDHLILFAWLLGDNNPPDRINSWKKEELRQIKAMHGDLKALKADGVDEPSLLFNIETSVKFPRGAYEAAKACDRFWGPHMSPLFKEGTVNSFSGLYAAVFRATSAYVHPSLRGSMGFLATPTTGGTSGKDFRLSRSFADHPGIYVQAVVTELLALWIFVARFRHDDVPKILPLVDRVIRLTSKT
ncbi:DUF5677 domain-containing protein [Streptomyces agglomeratus]|uniref:DUF5677 domain-containing protein n=1 Tax=Streptomyces agglomeratus TaxID=285458 RepID=UPI00114D2C53|nr:DUF5677 domain-containing protein [Streptomyces agglomeratus]